MALQITVQISDHPQIPNLKRKVICDTTIMDHKNNSITVVTRVMYGWIQEIDGQEEWVTSGLPEKHINLVADNTSLVNDSGMYDPINGTHPQYDYLYFLVDNGIVTVTNAIRGSILQADALGRFN
jgi:hypothetical protein